MKKTYMNPEILVVKVHAMQILAGSETLPGDRVYGTGEGITLGAREDDYDWEDE